MFNIRSVFGVCLVSFCLVGSVVADSTIDGRWDFRGNGTSTGNIEISGSGGTIQFGSSQVDTLSNIQLSDKGSLGQRKITFSRTGQYPQSFTGWLSYDNCQISGYYIHSSEEYPWNSYKDSCNIGNSASSNTNGSTATVKSNLDISVPSASYGNSNIWVDLEYKGASGFDHLWKLKDYGVNQ